MDNQINSMHSSSDLSPKVLGIGGIFFKTENLDHIKEWYIKNLGIEINNWGSSSFESRDINNAEQIISLQWAPFKKDSDYFEPSTKEFMINYRVQNIEGLIEQMERNGVTIVGEIVTHDYGKFAHILDTEGTKIELWEPNE